MLFGLVGFIFSPTAVQRALQDSPRYNEEILRASSDAASRKACKKLAMFSTVQSIIKPQRFLLMMKTLLGLALLIALTMQANPGILITVPFPISPPIISLDLPYLLPDILIDRLELTNTKLINVDYQWQLTAPSVNVNISKAVLSFDWSYKQHVGKGFFTEDHMQVIMHWIFTQNKQHLYINVERTQLKSGHSHVSLGGGVPETVAVEVTNLILNHASAVFRKVIGDRLGKVVEDLSKAVGEDKELLDVAGKGKLMLSTMLTSQPLLDSKTLYLQINGAAYIHGEQPSYLSPPQVLTAPTISKIQAQIHTKLLESIVEQYTRLTGGINMEFKSYDINSVLLIDTLALSPVFPPMAKYQHQVIFNVIIPSFKIAMLNSIFTIKAEGHATVAINKGSIKESYMLPVNGGFSLSLMPIFGPKATSMRITRLAVDSFSPDPSDIKAGLVIPSAVEKYFGVLMDWIQDAANLELNRRLIRPRYQNIQILLDGETYKDYSYNIQIELVPASQI